tara:strand:- start:302 stop:1117 length:816 start_codon:yes stop_codon:yes gene_type:complete
MLKERLISATLLASLLSIIILFLSDELMIYFLAFVTCISLWEFLKVRFSSFLTFITLSLFVSLLFLSQVTFFSYLFIALSVILYLSSSVFILSFPLNKTFLKNPITWVGSGYIIHLGFFASIFQILSSENLTNFSINIENERFLILYVILISILMDSIAYFVGKNYGKRPFINNVSPNKTLEGFLSALVLTPFLLFTFSSSFFDSSTIIVFLIFLVVSVFSVLGDALASMIKRVIEIKDFSNLIPGHGGVYDRLDSHIAVFPCFTLLLYLF